MCGYPPPSIEMVGFHWGFGEVVMGVWRQERYESPHSLIRCVLNLTVAQWNSWTSLTEKPFAVCQWISPVLTPSATLISYK